MPAKPTAAESAHAAVDKWWQVLHRAVLAQLVFSLLMQVAYVAFPAYNFAIALWCLVCCTPKWFAKNPRLTVLVLGAVGVSLLTDIIWISLWVSGRVFYDQFCGTRGVSIVSCGGASDYFPGCTTNRFSLFAMLMNDVAKVATMVSIARVRALQFGGKKNGDSHHVTPATDAPSPSPRTATAASVPGDAPVAVSVTRSGSVHQLPASQDNDHAS